MRALLAEGVELAFAHILPRARRAQRSLIKFGGVRKIVSGKVKAYILMWRVAAEERQSFKENKKRQRGIFYGDRLYRGEPDVVISRY